MRFGSWHVLVIALVMTSLNSVKPLTIDDAFFYDYAVAAMRHPTDPFREEPFWDGSVKLIPPPPVLPYWWAAGMALFGDHECLWKLWQLPILLVLLSALQSLAKRFASSVEKPLLWMVALSPAILPSINYMLDVPALAFTLAAVACFLSAVDRDSWGRALTAGTLAGLAMQTKYTGVTAAATILVYGLLTRRWRLTALAIGAVALSFLAWEVAIYSKYGDCQFLFATIWRYHRGSEKFSAARNVLGLITVNGCVAPALVVLGLAAIGAQRRMLACAVVATIVPYALLGILPVTPPSCLSALGVLWHRISTICTVDLIGLSLTAITVLVVWREYLSRWPQTFLAERFLLLWLGVEIAFYFPLTPFPAARRVLGITTVLALVFAQQFCRRIDGETHKRRLVTIAAAMSVGLGLLFWTIDCADSWAQMAAARRATAFVRSRTDRGAIWCTGNWGFLYYLQRAGVRNAVDGKSCLKTGDWLVLPRLQAGEVETYTPDSRKVSLAEKFIVDCPWLPCRTQTNYYSGIHPLQRRFEPQMVVEIYRVTGDFVWKRPAGT